MESRRLLLLAWLSCCALPAAGCRTAQLTEPLERENRHLEDRIYMLQDHVDELHSRLESCRRENEALRRRLGTDNGGTSGGASGGRNWEDSYVQPGMGAEPRTNVPPPLIEGGGIPAPGGLPAPSSPRTREPLGEAPPFQGPPEISPPNPTVPEGQVPSTPLAPPEQGAIEITPEPSEPRLGMRDKPVSYKRSDTPPGEPELAGEAAVDPAGEVPQPSQAGDVAPEDYSVHGITLNRFLTGGFNRDGVDGDDGMMVVIEPRNRRNEIIEVPGEVSIVVLDPALDGQDARIARWDFTSDEAADRFQRSRLSKGMVFELPWPNRLPQNANLQVFVRYTLPDQQQFVVDKPVTIETPLAGQGRSEGHSAGTVVNEAPRQEEPKAKLRYQRPEPTAPLPGASPSAGATPPAAQAPAPTSPQQPVREVAPPAEPQPAAPPGPAVRLRSNWNRMQ